ncbi:hypothetical protein KCP76_12885 [Salmonella enterica subsp. enterica serovar Weltevreden]|nr:hypothetical protein KCP76_12885 [Salmonella enterica subsp. enterica serovar Weltevreden]
MIGRDNPARIREIAETRIRHGCPRIHIQLRREDGLLTTKKTHRMISGRPEPGAENARQTCQQHAVSSARS